MESENLGSAAAIQSWVGMEGNTNTETKSLVTWRSKVICTAGLGEIGSAVYTNPYTTILSQEQVAEFQSDIQGSAVERAAQVCAQCVLCTRTDSGCEGVK